MTLENCGTLKAPSDLFDETWKTVVAELNADSERASAIVGSAYLDDLLGQLLELYLVENDDAARELLSSENVNAPLGSLGSRIVAAYAVGILRGSERDALRKIKNIRNRFAHDLDLSFGVPSIAALCEQLGALCPSQHFGSGQRGPRELFQDTVAFLAGGLKQKLWMVDKFALRGGFAAVFRVAASASRTVDGKAR
jgi:hypothetical protein